MTGNSREIILVTGGAGFIGSALIWALNRRGISDILVVDHLGNSEKWKNLRGLEFSDYMEKGDFLDRISSQGALPRVNTVFHLGACSDTTEDDCSYLIKNNYEYTKTVATYALKRDLRFIYASSAATYGDGSLGFVDDEAAIKKLVPLNMYGYSKQMFDMWALNRGVLDRMTGLKFFNVYGPNEYHKGGMRSFILKGYEQIVESGSLGLFRSCREDYADGEQLRDFVYVKDAVEMALFFLDHPEATGLFNIGTGEARTWNDLARAIFAAAGVKEDIRYIDMPLGLRDKYQYYTCADTRKIRSYGYTAPVMSLEDAVSDYVREYLVDSSYLAS